MKQALNKLDRNHLILASIIIFFAASNIIWIKENQAPPMWDQAGYLEGSEILYHTLTEKGIVSFLEVFSTILRIKAPLISVLPIPFYLLFGHSYTSALYVNVFFIIIGGVYLYKLAALMYGEKEALLSVLAVNTFPLVLGLSREFLVEYGLMVLVIMWMYYLLLSDSFENTRYSCILGAILGLGMLMKITFLLYILVPTIVAILKRSVQSKKMSGASLHNILLSVLTGTVISGFWYFRNLPSVVDFALKSGYSEVAANYGMGSVFSLNTVLAYLTYLVNYGISVYYFVLAMFLSLAIVLYNSSSIKGSFSSKNFLLLLAWLLFPLIIFTFGVNKDYRYTSAILPALAVMISAAMIKILWKDRKKVFIFLLLFFPVFNYLYISFSSGSQVIQLKGFKILENHLGFAHPPLKEQWPNEKAVKLIYKDKMKMNTNRGSARATALFDHIYINQSIFNYYSKKTDLGVSFNTIDSLRTEPVNEIVAQIEEDSDYIIGKSDKLGPDFTNVKNVLLAEQLAMGNLHFHKIAEIPLPDQTVLTIHKKNRDASVFSGIDELAENHQIDNGKSINFSDKIRLISYKLKKIKDGYTIVFFWECLTQMEQKYKIFVHVRDSSNRPVANADHYPNRRYPTSEWGKGEVIRDEIIITAPLPEKFKVYIGIYEEVTGSRLPVKDRSKNDVNGTQLF